MALGHLAPGSRGRCVRPNNLAALVEVAPRGACPPPGGGGFGIPREEEEEEEEEDEEGLFKASAVNEEEEGEGKVHLKLLFCIICVQCFVEWENKPHSVFTRFGVRAADYVIISLPACADE